MAVSSTAFAPLAGLGGGMLIGLSALLMLWLNGRITGISGIAAGLMARSDVQWRALFILGLWLGAILYAWLGPGLQVELPGGVGLMAVAGFLVGFGTRLGSGCTAGHGICGLSRLSKRSLVATATFFLAAMVTVYVVRHLGL